MTRAATTSICEYCKVSCGRFVHCFTLRRICWACHEAKIAAKDPEFTLLSKTRAKEEYLLTDKAIAGLCRVSVGYPNKLLGGSILVSRKQAEHAGCARFPGDGTAGLLAEKAKRKVRMQRLCLLSTTLKAGWAALEHGKGLPVTCLLTCCVVFGDADGCVHTTQAKAQAQYDAAMAVFEARKQQHLDNPMRKPMPKLPHRPRLLNNDIGDSAGLFASICPAAALIFTVGRWYRSPVPKAPLHGSDAASP